MHLTGSLRGCLAAHLGLAPVCQISARHTCAHTPQPPAPADSKSGRLLRALHIEGLPLSMTASRLSELMSVYGPVQYAEVRKAVMVLWWAWMEGGGLCWRRGHGTCLRFPHWGGSGSSRQARTAAAYAGSFTAPPRTPPRRPRQRL